MARTWPSIIPDGATTSAPGVGLGERDLGVALEGGVVVDLAARGEQAAVAVVGVLVEAQVGHEDDASRRRRRAGPRSATCTMPSGSEAPEPVASLRSGTPKRMTAPMPRSASSATSLRSDSRVCCTTPGSELIGCGSSMPSRTNSGATRSSTPTPGLGHQPPQRRGAPQPAQATLREGHAVEGTAAASSVAPCSLRRKKSRISSARCTRCRGEPDRDSSWLSAGNRWYSCSRPSMPQGDEQLVGLLDVAAQVVLRVEDQHRRGDVLHVGDRRGAQELVGVIQVVHAHHEAEEAAGVGRASRGSGGCCRPARSTPPRSGRCGRWPTTSCSRRRSRRGCRPGPGRGPGTARARRPARHHVLVVDAAPAAARPHLGQRRADGPGPVVGLARRAARVAVHDREARRGPQLELVEPVEAVLRHRSAVDAEQRRHLRGRIGQVDALRGDDPGVDRAARRRRTAPGRARPAGRGPRRGTWRRRR